MLNAEQIKLLEKPFAKDEHSTVQGNPYILKSAIRRRLWQVDPNYQLGAPELVIHDQDVIVLRGALTVGGVTHYGVGTGLIIRTRKDENTGEIFDLPLYDIARNMAKAYKQAASDILPRAAVQFNCGAYLAEKPKGMSLEALLAKLNGKSQSPPNVETPPEQSDMKAWAAAGSVQHLLNRCAQGLGLTWGDVSRLTGIAELEDYPAWNKYATQGAAAEAIKAALDKELAALPPASPKQPVLIT